MSYLLRASSWDFTDPKSVPNLFLDHLFITVLTLVISLAIAFPLALLVMRYTRLNLPVQTVAGVLYTIPSYAFLAYMIHLTGFSLWTLVIPLVLYAQVVLVRNIVAAVRAVDPALVEVGQALGMDRVQLFVRVVLPQALPLIVAGIRIVAVTTIGIATLGPVVAVDNLGTLIFDGINFSQNDKLIAGALVVTLLAIGVDLALLAAQRAASRGRPAVAR